ncbi:HvfC/BufC N-terminal domain-containing protein [Mesorhizobium sp. ORM8.1]
MLSLDERLGRFGAALLVPSQPIPPGLVGPDGEPSPKRFAVYRNNVVVGLTEALRAAYSAVVRIVGDEFFDAMAGVFLRHSPPATPVLLDYGADFPGFLRGFPPAASVPYLSDVACIERCFTESFHGMDAISLDPAAFSTISTDIAPWTSFSLHPTLRLVRSTFPALTIWQMNQPGGSPALVNLDVGEDVMLVRPDADVEIRAMPAGAFEFVSALGEGRCLAEAAKAGLGADERFDLAGNIQDLIAIGVLTGWHIREEHRHAG